MPMMPEKSKLARDPTQKLKLEMSQLIAHLRLEVDRVEEPKSQALFETSAEVLTGLVKAFDESLLKTENAWKSAGSPTATKG